MHYQSLIRSYLFFSLLFLSLKAYNWSQPYATCLFAPGLWSSEHQAAKYCTAYKASTGQTVTSTHGFEGINGTTCIACNFPEISLRKIYTVDDVYLYMIPLLLWRSLLTHIGRHILTTSNNRYQIMINGAAEHDFSIEPYYLNLTKLNFGQELDVQTITTMYQTSLEDTSLPHDIILFGVSRGAVAVFNFIATEYIHQSEHRVKALILESCFDALYNITPLSPLLSLLLPHYNHSGIAPIRDDILENFVSVCNHYNIPVLMISSHADQRVPYKNTHNLYQQLQNAGLNNLHLVTLHHSIHSGYTHDDEDDTKTYLQALHTFYKQYGLSHIADYTNSHKSFLK